MGPAGLKLHSPAVCGCACMPPSWYLHVLCWLVCGIVPQDTHNLRKDTGVRGSDSDACCGQQQRLEQRGQRTSWVRLWSKGCGPAQCTHVHFYYRAVAMRSALMSTFITELWPCAVHSCPLSSQSCSWGKLALMSTFITELWPCAMVFSPLLPQTELWLHSGTHTLWSQTEALAVGCVVIRWSRPLAALAAKDRMVGPTFWWSISCCWNYWTGS